MARRAVKQVVETGTGDRSPAEQVDKEVRIADLSSKLAEEMAASEKAAKREAALQAVSVFDSNNRTAERELSAPFMDIIETRLSVDVVATYKRLVEDLQLGERRTDFGVTQKHLDEAETNARDAFALWMAAAQERKRWQLENDVVAAAMRTQAVHAMQEEKERKERSKNVTERDIDLKCAELFPDEWREQELLRKKVELLEADMKHLSEMWNQRVYTLNTMLNKSRG